MTSSTTHTGIGSADVLATFGSTPSSAPYLPPKGSYMSLSVGYNGQDNPAIPVVFAHPSVSACHNIDPVWFKPNLSDAKQYGDTQGEILAQARPRINWWKKYVGSDGEERWMYRYLDLNTTTIEAHGAWEI